MPIHLRREDIKHKLTVILSEQCKDIEPFAKKIAEWSSNRSKTPISIPTCSCRDAVCAIDLTEHIPKPFYDKMDNNLRCNGPNCINATLIAAGFLGAKQLRYSNELEFDYFLKNYCRKVPVKNRQAFDIILDFTPNGTFKHCGFYIGSDLLFTKNSPSKNSLISLQNWSDKFNSSDDSLDVYRCKKMPTQRISPISLLEAQYTEVFDAKDLNEVKKKIDDVERDLAQVDEDSLSDMNWHAFQSLKTSLILSKDVQMKLLTKNISVLVSIKAIRAIKNSDTKEFTKETLKVGDWVMVEHANKHIFEPGIFYQVLDIL